MSQVIVQCYKSPIWIITLGFLAIIAICYSGYNFTNAAIVGSHITLGLVFLMAGAVPVSITYLFTNSKFSLWRAIIQWLLIVVAFAVTVGWLYLSDIFQPARISFLKGAPSSNVLHLSEWVIIPGMVMGLCASIILRRGLRDIVDELRKGQWFGMIRLRHVMLFIILLMVTLSAMYTLRGEQWDSTPTSDAYFYERMGFELALGNGFISTYYQPLYLIWLAWLYYFWGHYFFLIQIANVLCVIATVVLFYAAARIWTLNTPVALITAFFIATCNNTVYWVYTSQVEPFNQLLVGMNFYLFARVLKDSKAGNLVQWGLSWAVLILCRTQNAGLIVGQIVLYLIIYVAIEWKLWWKRIAQAVAGLAIALTFLIIPIVLWGTYNLYTRGQFMMASPRGGLDFWRGNLPGYREGIFYYYYDNDHHDPKHFDGEYSRLTNSAKTQEEINRILVRDAFRLIVAHPIDAMDRAARRFVLFMDLYRPGWYSGRAANWSEDWRDYVKRGFQSMLALGSIFLMLIFFRSRLLWASLILIMLYMLPFLFIISYESRIRWPIDHLYLMNIAILIYCAMTARKVSCICDKVSNVQFTPNSLETIGRPHRMKKVIPLFGLAVFILVGSRVMIGAPNLLAPIKAEGAKRVASITIDQISPEIPRKDCSGNEPFKDDMGGRSFLMECVPTNYSIGSGCYSTWPPPLPDRFSHCTYSNIALCFKGATIEADIHEGDRILVYGHVQALGKPTRIQVEQAMKKVK